ncbi:MAG: S8 family serine peptidase [Phycisphaerae bacterium]|nr:S8 family serine peptidase [Phycisphaerae bacterium]
MRAFLHSALWKALPLSLLASITLAGDGGIGLRVDANTQAALHRAGVRPIREVDYGTFQWVELSAGEAAKLANASIAIDPGAFTLTLGDRTFDPLRDGIADLRTQAGDAQRDLRLVQFAGPTKSDWLPALESKGAKVVQYIPPFTYVVWASREEIDVPALAAGVRWTGDFAPEYRLLNRFRPSPDITNAVAAPYRVLVPNVADIDRVAADLQSLGIAVQSAQTLNQKWTLLSISAAANQLDAASSVRGVYSLQSLPADGGLRGEMSSQLNVNNVDEMNRALPGYAAYLATLGLSGAGVIVADVDSGIRDNHLDLINRMNPCVGPSCGDATTASNHGTHTAGIIAGDGSSGVIDGNGFLRGLGVAPGARLVEQRYFPTYTEPGGMLTLMRTSIRNGAHLSSNSWGPAGTPRGYDADTLQVDIGVRDADDALPGNQQFHFILSIMNGYGGTSSQGTPDEAKNCFTVGSTRMQSSAGGAQYAEIDDISANSAHGPALDGRIIPHIVAPGCWVDSTLNTTTYGFDCGTSMAAPQVAGGVALFLQYFRALPGYSVDPSPALVKAAFTAVAHSLAGHLDADGVVLDHPFDRKQGWGRMDLRAVIAPTLAVQYWDNPQVFDATGQQWTQLVRAADENAPIRIMLAWTDAPGHGLGGATPAWNNDLDLVVENGADLYRGNAFGPDGLSTLGGVADPRNNTEGAFLNPATSAIYNLRVVAANINSDAIPGDAALTDQDFALVCYNCLPVAPPPLMGDMNCDGVLSVGDIAGFVLALTDPDAYALAYPECDINRADINADLFISVGDIAGFVSLLTGEG